VRSRDTAEGTTERHPEHAVRPGPRPSEEIPKSRTMNSPFAKVESLDARIVLTSTRSQTAPDLPHNRTGSISLRLPIPLYPHTPPANTPAPRGLFKLGHHLWPPKDHRPVNPSF
jgi:hypothetical protein